MKLLYLTIKSFDKGLNDGVVKKINYHISYFRKNGLEVDYSYVLEGEKQVCFNIDNTDMVAGKYNILGGINSKRIVFNYLKDFLKEKKYDAVYIRFLGGRTDPWALNIYKLLHKNGVKTILEFPTYPYDYEGSRADKFVDKLFRGNLVKYIDRIVTFSDDRVIYNIKTINALNPIDVNEVPINQSTKDGTKIHMIAVSSFIYYHGYERLLEGLAQYYHNKKDEDDTVILHMIGDGSEREYYESIVKENAISDYVIFHGYLKGEELNDIYKIADIAIGTLGAYKIKTPVLSSLKMGDYLLRGIPAVAGYDEVITLKKKTDFVYKCGFDNSNVDIRDTIKWYNGLLNRFGQKEELEKAVRNYVYDIVDIDKAYKPVLDYILN